MYLPSPDYVDFLKKLLDSLGIAYLTFESSYSPVMSFWFEGYYFWVIKKGEGFKLNGDDAKSLESLTKMYIKALNPEGADNEVD